MSYFDATIRDQFRKKRKRELDPTAAFKAHVKSIDADTNNLAFKQPAASLVQDPILELAKQQEKFHNFQVSSGLEIMKGDQGIETAADQQNLDIAKDELRKRSLGNDASLARPLSEPALNAFQNQPRFSEPHNNPFSSIPGGPGSGPMKPFPGT